MLENSTSKKAYQLNKNENLFGCKKVRGEVN